MMTQYDLLERMQRFVSGDDRSVARAGQIEVGLAEVFGEQEPFAELSLALASYQPGGGAFLYDEEQIVIRMKRAMQKITAGPQTRTVR